MYMVRASSPAAERTDFSKAQKDATLGHLHRNTVSHVAPEERKVRHLKHSEMNPPSSPEPQCCIFEPLSLLSRKGQVHHACRPAPVKWADNTWDIYYPAHLYHGCREAFRPRVPLEERSSPRAVPREPPAPDRRRRHFYAVLPDLISTRSKWRFKLQIGHIGE